MLLACLVHVSCMYFDMSRYPQSRVCVTGVHMGVQQCVYTGVTGVQQRRGESQIGGGGVLGVVDPTGSAWPRPGHAMASPVHVLEGRSSAAVRLFRRPWT